MVLVAKSMDFHFHCYSCGLKDIDGDASAVKAENGVGGFRFADYFHRGFLRL